ncbi:unannotated protein [freshwater metagenome]|uniref:Unannotated protein n=1 Tax=freshwater metagenome TaxID=449393 RepID=A0A6J7EN76_9ZZZZ
MRVLVTYGGYSIDHPDAGGTLARAGLSAEMHPRQSDRTPDELSALIGDAVAVIADADPFNADVLERAANLRVIARTGVGLDSIDLEAATHHGVIVTVTPNVNNETVADHTLALILAVLRRVRLEDARVRAGGWRAFEEPLGQIHGRTVGLIGYGAIGRAVARRIEAFGARLLVHDPFVDAAEVELTALDDLLAQSDIVSLHLPLSPETLHVIDADALARMKPGAVLVNTARGPLVDQAALVEALVEGRLGGAGLDVFETEPPAGDAVLALDRIVASPHIGGISDAANLAMSRLATGSVLAALDGRAEGTVVNPDALRNAVWAR